MTFPENKQEYRLGVFYGLLAYAIWGGVAPAFFKLLQGMSAYEIIAHRVLWSVVLLFVFMFATRTWQPIAQLFKQPKVIFILLLSSILAGGNWLIFVWAINNGQILETSLGYFILPLCNVFLGYAYFKERFSRLQWLALTLAVSGIVIQIWVFGSIPMVSLGLAGSFSLYGFIRKLIKVESVPGLFIETLWLSPVALAYLFWVDSPTSHLLQNDLQTNFLLLGCGLITTIPLLLFNASAIRVRLSTIGMMQYLGPTLSFLLAVFVFHEALGMDKWVTFGFIWVGVIIFVLDSVLHVRKVTTLLKHPHMN